jgi:hypothetical protein
VREVLTTPGRRLDDQTRSLFEPRFKHDFSKVRIHADAQAAESAQALNANAYSIGEHIVFDAGGYAPHGAQGRSLMAHELTHVVQRTGRSGFQGSPTLSGDHGVEAEADAVASNFEHSPGSAPLHVGRSLATNHIARQTKAQEFPGFSQGDFVTCGAASLVSAIMIADRERQDANTPNRLLVAACNTVLVYLDDHKNALVQGWNAISIKGSTGHGQDIYDEEVTSVKDVRDAVSAPKAQATQAQYQALSLALYVLFKNNSKAGLERSQIGRIQNVLGIGSTKSENGSSFDEVMDKLTGLNPGQTAQVAWYSRGPLQKDGTATFTDHVFLVGRFKRGAWYVSDQGDNPPTELEAASLDLLKMAIRSNTQAHDGGIHTGGLPAQNIGNGMQVVQIAPDKGVSILGDRAGIETKARDVIMVPGDFIAEIDVSALSSGDRLVAWDFVARTRSLADAQTELAGAGTGSGGVILENPQGLFHVFKTGLVSDDNVDATAIDDSDSKGGKLAPPKRYYHAWLQLRSSKISGSFFKVY